jgi:hypothetical protein
MTSVSHLLALAIAIPKWLLLLAILAAVAVALTVAVSLIRGGRARQPRGFDVLPGRGDDKGNG